MKQYKLTAPEKLAQTICLPASKSISNRALVIYALSGGKNLPQNLSDCDDTDVIIKALRDMPEEINIKAAGTAMRFMTAYLSVTKGTHVLTGTERMKHRPIGILVDAMKALGADIKYVETAGYPPLRITGKTLKGGLLAIPGNVSSQYISALLMIGPMLKNGLTLQLTGDIISRPYIDLTLWTMREFGAEAEWTSADTITVNPKAYQDREYFIENDWTGASYWYEMLALCKGRDSEIKLTGLMDGSKQGDSVTRYLFSLLGIKTTFETKKEGIPQTITLTQNGRCVPRLEYDFVNSPDLAQTFVVTCAAKNIPFHFKGLSTLKIKETDRIEAMKREMRKLGYVLHDANDSELYWNGERCEPSLELGIDTYEDHRMALAFAPYALTTEGLIINNPQVVTKSYPHFWDDLKNVGFKIEETDK
ncbi:MULTISPECIES: 3-phosphoshikimate 1-carboxyvinyltransferase [unclassified Prevotella]|jgi:3-phosphoshikimate 1-carboxyvinyltransferase|uniref:3-phosphoshikimate 1-carboxyvinyltransferase n=1 Tax=unclassified Prevotella TaxID=2638335 RepID=UPI00055A5D5B|nr:MULTISPECIES: 3-phosphoshikimate 1-carboxyvinyltransferase [unclassified Prevotella]MCR5469853.1 3-phosphoshikimate 1-carboxyvinyltransferase [Prevotella sp.]SEW09913.1 3-phosphoshikimate 1-carboxyvinyltransferase [Prevotella sp. khp7]